MKNLEKLLADTVSGPWEWQAENECLVGPEQIVLAQDDEGRMTFAQYPDGMHFNNANLIALAPSLAAALLVAEKALREVADIHERKKNLYPPDWREQIAACSECQRYKDHPIQCGICDDHRKPIYAQEDHDRHETTILGYRAKDIARAALSEIAKLTGGGE